MTPAGEKNRKVQILRSGGKDGVAKEDAYGQPVDSGDGGWTLIRTPWAKIDPQLGKATQPFTDGTFTAKVVTFITINYSKNDRITTADRVAFTEPGSGLLHTYQINDVVNPGQRNEDIILVCEELDGKA